MGLLEQQNFLAQIFTDEKMRRNFWQDPEKVGQENDLEANEIAQLKQIVSADLDFFADSLVHKRLHEVEKLLPLTRKALEANFSRLFSEFSQTFQPQSVKKHLEDAIEFCRFVRRNEDLSALARETAKFEETRHEFFSQKRTIAFCLLKSNLFSSRSKYGLAVWFRIGRRVRHFIL
jgi:hypothetical protein